MNDSLLATSETKVSRSIELGPDGLMTVAISMESQELSSNVQITSVWTYQAGWRNSLSKWLMRKAMSVLLSTRNADQLIQRSSTPPSPLDYSSIYYGKQGTNNA